MCAELRPELSLVVPIYNEAKILDEALPRFLNALEGTGLSFELILVENGSKDASPQMARAWEARDSRIRALHFPHPNYGAALKLGLKQARATRVICEEIDLGAHVFWSQALARIQRDGAALVVGSKAMPGAADERPRLRRAATLAYNAMLRLLFGYRGTDTHGVKVLDKARMAPVISACRSEFDVFASELVIRAQREGLLCLELPIRIRESRPTSIALHRRIPRVLSQLFRLARVIHSKPPQGGEKEVESPPEEGPS